MSILNAPWLARQIEVIESSDPTLVGVSGMIVEETARQDDVRRSHPRQGCHHIHHRSRAAHD